MKNIAIILTTILLSTAFANAEEKKTLEDVFIGDCTDKHKISPAALGCGIKKLFKKKDGTPNWLGRFFNAKTLADLNK